MKRRTGVLMALTVLSMTAAPSLSAQWNVARYGAGVDQGYMQWGLDPAVVTTLGYGRVVTMKNHLFQLSGDLGFVGEEFDVNDYRARVGVKTSLVRWGDFHVTGSFSALARGTENSIYQGFNWGADLTGTAGVYRTRWFAAAEVGKDKAVITNVKFTQWYRDNFYADAQDGWYLDAGGTVRAGLVAGLSLGRVEVTSRFGFVRTENLEDASPPVYATMGLGWHW